MIFISGYPRTGTSLMQGILCKDEQSFPTLQECEYFRDLIQTYYRGKTKWNTHTFDYFDNLEEFKELNKNYIRDYINFIQSKFGRNLTFIHKKPILCYYAEELYELVPNLKLIVMIRDPRDAIASLLKIKRDQGVPVVKLLQEYLDQYYRCFNFLKDKDDYMLIKYEDLLLNTNTIMNQLREFTNLELNFDPAKNNIPQIRHKDSRYSTVLDGKPINSNNIDEYINSLSEEELGIINANKEALEGHLNMKLFYEKE